MHHPTDVVAKAHELGLMNLHVPEQYGGLGLGAFDGMLVGEELYWGCAGIGTSITANGLGSGPVIIAGTDRAEVEVADAAPRGSRSSARSASPSRAPAPTSSLAQVDGRA